MPELIPSLTPMMQQYLQIKQAHQDAILFFRLGDFYEMFFEDAVKASAVLEIALTSRNKNEVNSVPLCGIPYHSASQYIRRLIEEGYKVAICEQVEDPKLAKGIVKREVTRVITPGLLVEEENLSAQEPNYLVSLVPSLGAWWAFYLDISTGEILSAFYENSDGLCQDLQKHRVKEILLATSGQGDFLAKLRKILPSVLLSAPLPASQDSASAVDSAIYSEAFLQSKQKIETPQAQSALDHLLTYVRHTQKSLLRHLAPIQLLRGRQFMGIDAQTFRHLELTQSAQRECKGRSLFSILNKTGTAMGARRLKKWIQYPLTECAAILARQEAIAELLQKPEWLLRLAESLAGIQDIERMLGKLALQTVNARDLYVLAQSLQRADLFIQDFNNKFQVIYLKEKIESYPDLKELYTQVLSRLQPELPATLREGGLIAAGVNAELDELRRICRDGKSVIAQMEEEEKKATQISSLKIRYNKIFGYYLEVTHAQRDKVPAHYIRKQTLANAERFITPRLKEYESKVLGAEERIKSLEYELFLQLRLACEAQIEVLQVAAEVLGTLDVISALARCARDYGYVRPELCEEAVLYLEDSRHPVVERESREAFIPNDIVMDATHNFLLLTGPNMAGKSTLMRQAALLIVMAQLGSFVPARSAKIGIVDQLFSRIGASDDIAQGHSTFMVEMLETSHILRAATERSFIILDEIGRGTSTYDGMSIAWAVAEHVAKKINCRTLFATHYHELTALSESLATVANFQIAVKEWNEQILFLRKLIPGGASRSYGIEVARLAGLPPALLDRAREILHQLENGEAQIFQTVMQAKADEQLKLFTAKATAVTPAYLEELRLLKPETLSPLEALHFLFQLCEKIRVETSPHGSFPSPLRGEGQGRG